jgi:hypothetical protein
VARSSQRLKAEPLAADSRDARLRRSVRRRGYDLADAGGDIFYICRDGQRVSGASDHLFDFSLEDVEARIKRQVRGGGRW